MTPKTTQIIRRLYQSYPDLQCDLTYKTPYQLLVAVMLSAQCTDKRVNMVTPILFEQFPTVHLMASASLKEIEALVKSTGFYKNKAKNILAMSEILVKMYGSELPKTLDELIALPGVGRKTANVILGELYKVPALVVDTHVKRISFLLGLTKETTPEKIEFDLMQKISKKYWIDYTHMLIRHGRAVCIARRPKCSVCILADVCTYNLKRG